MRNSPEAVNDLVTANLPLVGYHVSELLGRVPSYVSRDDLASAGSLALVLAAQAYDADTGVPFARYAALRIRGALVDELRSLDWASRSVRRRARQLDGPRSVDRGPRGVQRGGRTVGRGVHPGQQGGRKGAGLFALDLVEV